MRKFLYFATAGGADAAADNIVIPADTIIGMNATAADTCNVYFKNPRILEGTDGDSTKNYVELTYTSGKYKEVAEAVAEACSPNARRPKAMTTIADMNTSTFVHSAITAVIILHLNVFLKNL